MTSYKCSVYGPKGVPGCVIVTVIAESKGEAKRKAGPLARELWQQIPAHPKVEVHEVTA